MTPTNTKPNSAFDRDTNFSGLRTHAVGERKNPKQIVILLHGWGAPGDDLVPLGEALSAPGRMFVFPEAPLVSPGGGRAWWHLDVTRIQAAREQGQKRDLRAEQPDGLAEVSAQVRKMLDDLKQRAPDATFIIGGFSQGAMLATDVMLTSSGSLAGLVVMSGTLVNEAIWAPAFKKVRTGFPVFMSHGRGDPILPFELAEALRDHAQTSEHAVTWLPFEGGHEIPMPVLARLRNFLGSR
jgi:phospholipase/carboxylesterase